MRESRLIRQYAPERLDESVEVIEVSGALRDFLNERIAASKAGELSNKSFWQIVDEALAEDSAGK